MSKKGEYEKIFGTTKVKKNHWDIEIKKSNNHKSGKNKTKDIFGRNINGKDKKKKKKKKSLEKSVQKLLSQNVKAIWLPVSTDDISNFKDLREKSSAGLFRLIVSLDYRELILLVYSDGNGGLSSINCNGMDPIKCLTEFACGSNPTEIEISTWEDKLNNTNVFRQIECLNTSLIIEF